MPAADEVMVIRAATSPVIVHPLSDHRDAVLVALDRVTAGSGAKDLDAAFALARAALGSATALVHVFSDVRAPDELARSGRRHGFAVDDVQLEKIGGSVPNAGIVRLASAHIAASPLDHEVLALIGNFSSRERTVDVRLRTADDRRQVQRVSLGAGERKPVVFAVAAAAWVEVSIDADGDGFSADDRAWLVLPGGPIRVCHGSGGDPFLEAALRAHPRVRLANLGHEHGACSVADADLVVLDGAAPPDDLRLPALVVNSAGDHEPRVAPLVDWNRSHPLLRQLDLGDILIPAGTGVLSASAGDVLLRSTEGIVAVAGETHGTRWLHFAFPFHRSSVIGTPVFPILIARALEWLLEEDARVRNLRPGQPLRVALAQGRSGIVTVHRPDGEVVTIEPRDRAVEFTGTTLNGLYRVEGAGTQQWFAVSLLDPEESDVDRAESPRPAFRASEPAPREHRETVRPFLAAAVPLLSLEIWMLQRRLRRDRR
jgi:hypothetical protein